MDITKYFSRKRKIDEPAVDLSDSNTTSESDQETDGANTSSSIQQHRAKEPQRKKQHVGLTASEKKKIYKSKLSYKKEWGKRYPWVNCNDPSKGMFCGTCQRWGNCPAGAKGGWTTRGITDWNHATELLRQHADSQWHRDAAATAAMALQAEKGKSVLELQRAGAAKEAAERRQRNRDVLLKLLRSTYFLVKNRIPHTTVYPQLIELQVANGDQILEQHINKNPLNAQYTSKFSTTMLIEAIDIWLDRKLLSSLKSSPFFSILADECQDISSQEELSICCRWLVNGCPEEHYLTTLHVKSTDAASIADTLTSFISDKGLDYRKLVGQGYDGAATFSGVNTGVQRRIRVHAAHALYIHCSCHRLQLASIQAAQSVETVYKMFGTMQSLWKLFYYSPKKAQALKDVQAVLSLPELKIVKPSDTRWLSHERCIRAIRKELPSLIITLETLYDDTGDAEAYGLAIVLSSFSGIATIFLLSAVLDLLAKLNCFMQRKTTDFSRLPVILEAIITELKDLKGEGAEWCSLVETTISKLTNEYDITLRSNSTRSGQANATTISQYRDSVAIPYIDQLISNINSRFSNTAVKLLVSSSVFNPASIPEDERALPEYGNEKFQALVDFYGREVTVEFDGTTYASSPLIDSEEILSEWRLFKRALAKETKTLVRGKKLTKAPTLQEVKTEMESTEAYTSIFPEMFKLLNILLSLPVGTATVERSFSQMKLIKTRLRSRISDHNLARLMRIAIEGPELSVVDFNEILDVFKEKNRRIQL